MKIEYGTQTIEFNLVRSSRVKNIYISVDKTSEVVVKTPKSTTESEVINLVKSKAKWILKQLSELQEKSENQKICSGSRIFYMGKSYYVEFIKEDTRKNIEVIFIHSKFKIYTPIDTNQISINKAIEDFYLKKSKEKITRLVKKHSDIMKLYPKYIGFRKSKTKWGSCSSNDRITFNPEVIKLPSSLIEYVVIHELSHIKYKNHSKDFWNLVKKFKNDYQKMEERLREFEKKV